jgi:hypothetical protein
VHRDPARRRQGRQRDRARRGGRGRGSRARWRDRRDLTMSLASANLMIKAGGPTGTLTVRYRKPTPLSSASALRGLGRTGRRAQGPRPGHCLRRPRRPEAEAVFVRFSADRQIAGPRRPAPGRAASPRPDRCELLHARPNVDRARPPIVARALVTSVETPTAAKASASSNQVVGRAPGCGPGTSPSPRSRSDPTHVVTVPAQDRELVGHLRWATERLQASAYFATSRRVFARRPRRSDARARRAHRHRAAQGLGAA